MTDQPTPADDAWLDAMADKANKRLGEAIATVTRAVFDADRFDWRPPGIQATVAAAFHQLRDYTDIAGDIATVITTVYADHGHPHDPAAVRTAVARQLADADDPDL